eukprot:CAMPEP_0170595152 /NCGR_PEP_ID=MMETSP0224-20130122/14399_1 /TAXON_ID=285029 /ORGANISM="Togula jolla, Strain CCCM 725" /LENGTH=279 /DNA_ID=CAMNT_0010919293 /DNA_START=90 /DNA_END=931 /DNA_ORIENTATION=+
MPCPAAASAGAAKKKSRQASADSADGGEAPAGTASAVSEPATPSASAPPLARLSAFRFFLSTARAASAFPLATNAAAVARASSPAGAMGTRRALGGSVVTAAWSLVCGTAGAVAEAACPASCTFRFFLAGAVASTGSSDVPEGVGEGTGDAAGDDAGSCSDESAGTGESDGPGVASWADADTGAGAEVAAVALPVKLPQPPDHASAQLPLQQGVVLDDALSSLSIDTHLLALGRLGLHLLAHSPELLEVELDAVKLLSNGVVAGVHTLRQEVAEVERRH